MEPYKIDRINALARKSREFGLTDEEALEQKALREEYIGGFRDAARAVLDNTYIERPDGTREKLIKTAKPEGSE